MDKNAEIIFNLFLMELWKDFNCAGYEIKDIEDCLQIYNLNSFSMLKDCFPENEVCDEVRETCERLSCGCCSTSVYKPANYIDE